jgi:hypothetical protein
MQMLERGIALVRQVSHAHDATADRFPEYDRFLNFLKRSGLSKTRYRILSPTLSGSPENSCSPQRREFSVSLSLHVKVPCAAYGQGDF